LLALRHVAISRPYRFGITSATTITGNFSAPHTLLMRCRQLNRLSPDHRFRTPSPAKISLQARSSLLHRHSTRRRPQRVGGRRRSGLYRFATRATSPRSAGAPFAAPRRKRGFGVTQGFFIIFTKVAAHADNTRYSRGIYRKDNGPSLRAVQFQRRGCMNGCGGRLRRVYEGRMLISRRAARTLELKAATANCSENLVAPASRRPCRPGRRPYDSHRSVCVATRYEQVRRSGAHPKMCIKVSLVFSRASHRMDG
jgi:hypothetical protein